MNPFHILSVFVARSARSLTLEECLKRLEEIPRQRFETLIEYVEDRPRADVEFWRKSEGLKGIVARLEAMSATIHLLQYCVGDGFTTEERAYRVWQLARMQCFYSLLAFPEALLCRVWPMLPHIAARESLDFHWQATLQTLALCQVDNAPECILDRGFLL